MSAEMAKEARRAMRAKAVRLSGGTNDPHKRVDGSSWEPTEALNADRKTGARPVRPRIYRNHGGPVALQKDRGPQRADKKARADGGRADTPGAESTIDTAGANKKAFGSYHEGGYKKGGDVAAKDVHKHERNMHKGKPLTELATGGKAGSDSSLKRTASWVIRENGTNKPVMETFDRKKADAVNTKKYHAIPIGEHLAEVNRNAQSTREGRKNGGKAATINIVIAGGGPKQDPMQQGPQGPIKPMPPPMPPPGPMAGGPPPGGPPGLPPGMPPGGPPMPMGRKDGGPVMHYGAGGGQGRLEKIGIQKRSKRADGGKADDEDRDKKPPRGLDKFRGPYKYPGDKDFPRSPAPRDRRASGGMTAGAGSGEGRLEKIKLQEDSRR